MRLSVLDQSPIREGGSASDALRETLDLAQACERFGYHRYWLAEHHNATGLAGSTPEILIGRVASLTKTMRIGSGGVMLSHYAALKVAENFRMLEALYPGRIDLGIGRAPGSDQLTAAALSHGPGALPIERFPYQINDLLGFLNNSLQEDHPFFRVRAMPDGHGGPEVWLLGSTDQSAGLAAYFGLPFSFAHFINDQGGVEVMAAYREAYRPASRSVVPQGSVGVFVLCAETDDEADRIAKSRDLWRVRFQRGDITPIPAIETALAYPYTREDEALIRAYRRRTIVGSPATVRAKVEALAQAYGVDEVVVVSICYDFAARLRSYELLAQAFELPARL